jgi:hypothetical protein
MSSLITWGIGREIGFMLQNSMIRIYQKIHLFPSQEAYFAIMDVQYAVVPNPSHVSQPNISAGKLKG